MLCPSRHGSFVPCVDGSELACVDGSELARTFLTPQAWSVQPCVRPVCAVHMTAGHNALRGSGPGQKPAFENAVAQVGCPDRRIDRLCITCCSSSPTFTSRQILGAISLRPERDRIIISLAARHQCPCVDGSGLARTFLTPQAWSVQPCVRPVCAVHMTAGHNALRGSLL